MWVPWVQGYGSHSPPQASQHWQLWDGWAKSVETSGCRVGQWLFCFSDLCSWTHSPLQSGDLSQRLAKPWGDNFQGLSNEIQRQHPPRSRWAELEHPKWADGWDCGKNRFWWGQTLHLFLGDVCLNLHWMSWLSHIREIYTSAGAIVISPSNLFTVN